MVTGNAGTRFVVVPEDQLAALVRAVSRPPLPVRRRIGWRPVAAILAVSVAALAGLGYAVAVLVSWIAAALPLILGGLVVLAVVARVAVGRSITVIQNVTIK